MKNGIAYKNLTDALVLVAAVVAIIGVLLAILSFDKPYKGKDPVTNEEIDIQTPFDDPYVETYVNLAVVFSFASVLGFLARRLTLIPIVGSVCSIVVAMNYFMDGLVKSYGFLYVLLGVVGLAGNIIYSVMYNIEQKEEIAARRRARKLEKAAAKSGKK